MHRSQMGGLGPSLQKGAMWAASAALVLTLVPGQALAATTTGAQATTTEAAQAADDEAPADATLTLVMQYEADGKDELVDGVEATLYKVASLDDAVNHYVLLDQYESLGVDFNKGLDASQMQEAAKKAQAIASNGDKAAAVATSGKDGKAAFGTLEYGVYLAVQTGAIDTAKAYRDFEPFLISVPRVTEDGVEFDVVAQPKLTPGDAPKPEEPPVTPPTPSTSPKTGDVMNPQAVVACVVGGGVLVLAGLMLRKRSDRSDS